MQTLEKIDKTKPMFTISVVADILQVHQRTLRIYDTENLLKPSRSPKGRRLYSMNDIEKGHLIQYLTRDLGVNLIGIKIIFQILNDDNLPESARLEYLEDTAEHLRLTKQMQEANREKLSRRGRKVTR